MHTTEGEKAMKLLSIKDGAGYYLGGTGDVISVDKLTKEDLLRLVNLTLTDEAEFDEYDESVIKNKAHQIVYKSVFEKLRELSKRKQEFIDESERLFLDAYEKYREDSVQKST